MPVVHQLLGVAAAAPRQQLQVLLQAAAEAGNLETWRQLLQANNSTQQQQQQQQQQDRQEQQQEEETAAAAFPRLDWSCLSLQQLTSALHLALPKRVGEFSHNPGSSQQQQWQAAEDAARLQMADLLWQQLVVQQGREAALRQYLRAPVPPKHRGTQNPGIAADAAAEDAAAYEGIPKAAIPGAHVNGRQLFCYVDGTGPWGKRCEWWELSAARVMWLQQRQLVPEEQLQYVYCALKSAVEVAAEAGEFSLALQLYNMIEGLDGVQQHPMLMKVAQLVESSIGGHLRRACAAGDAAAVAQLERLVRFGGAFSDTTVSLRSAYECLH
jgi:hypothetical protein